MAYTTITPQPITRTGISPTYTAAPGTGSGNGIKFSNNGRRFIEVTNTGGSACTVTVNIGATVDGQAVTARTYTIAATTGDQFIGPFTSDYNQPDGTVAVDFSNITSVTVGVFEM